jgi:methylmalonyl-CoA decarboxylase
MSLVVTKIDGFIGTLTLNRPEKLNALSNELVGDIISALKCFKKEKVRVGILKATTKTTKAGRVIWSTGHDVSELPDGRRDPLGCDDSLRCLIREIKDAPFPIIAMAEGEVWGGACELIFACSMIVALPNVTFAFTPAKLGVPYNLSGLSTFMNDTGLHLLKEMICTAAPIGVARFERAGIVNYILPAGELEKKVTELAEQTVHNAPLAITAMLAELNMMAGARDMSPSDFEKIQGLRRRSYDSTDYIEARKAFFEKRTPIFTGE